MQSLTLIPLAVATALLVTPAPDASVVVGSQSETSTFLSGFTTVGTRHREFEPTVGSSGDQEQFPGRNDLGNDPIAQPAIPEPATRVMMIAGFAFVGPVLRG